MENEKIKYDIAGHVVCKHRKVNDGPSRDWCNRRHGYCRYRGCEEYAGHENDGR